jgi:hypothetical protein
MTILRYITGLIWLALVAAVFVAVTTEGPTPIQASGGGPGPDPLNVPWSIVGALGGLFLIVVAGVGPWLRRHDRP